MWLPPEEFRGFSGRKCIVSLSMLTRGRDYNILTHIIGLRRFTSRLLYEQVVGRGRRRFR